MNIPEEAIDAVASAIEVARYHDGVDAHQIAERALREVAAPLIAAQVLREAADKIEQIAVRPVDVTPPGGRVTLVTPRDEKVQRGLDEAASLLRKFADEPGRSLTEDAPPPT